jgi:hypothetical protein
MGIFKKVVPNFSTPANIPAAEAQYTYFLKCRTTGLIVELGPSGELSEEAAKFHGIEARSWDLDWEFCCIRVPARIAS